MAPIFIVLCSDTEGSFQKSEPELFGKSRTLPDSSEIDENLDPDTGLACNARRALPAAVGNNTGYRYVTSHPQIDHWVSQDQSVPLERKATRASSEGPSSHPLRRKSSQHSAGTHGRPNHPCKRTTSEPSPLLLGFSQPMHSKNFKMNRKKRVFYV